MFGCCYEAFFQWLSDVYEPIAGFKKKNVKNLASQTDFQFFFQVQLSGQLEEREMARAMASYVFPMFKAGVGEETPAEIGILRMILNLSMKLGPDNIVKITMWVFPKIMVPPNHQF